MQKKSKFPLLSLCMIVKNEQRNLAECLSSVKNLVDQIIIVDTGSTDNTIKIANEFNAEVYEHAWQDDFAYSRNLSLKYAQAQWMLVLDADHILRQEKNFNLRGMLKNTNQLGFVINEKSYIHQKLVGQIHRLLLIKNIPGVKFKGKIHENPLDSVYTYAEKNNISNPIGKLNQIWVDHKGFEDPLVKLQRNLPILKKAVEDHPQDSHYQYKFLLSLKSVNQINEYNNTIKASYEKIKHLDSDQNISNSKLGIFGLYGQWLCSNNASDLEVKTFLDIAFDWGEKINWSDARLVLPCARLLIKKGEINKAQSILERCVSAGTGEATSTLSLDDRLNPYILLFDLYRIKNETTNIFSLITKLSAFPDKMKQVFEKIAQNDMALFDFIQNSIKSQQEAFLS